MASIRSELARSLALFDAFEERLQKAERLDSIGRVAGGVAHDFNNLLTVILSSAAILERQLDPGSSGTFPVSTEKEITEAGTRASKLAQDGSSSWVDAPTPGAVLTDVNEVLIGMSRIVERPSRGTSTRSCF